MSRNPPPITPQQPETAAEAVNHQEDSSGDEWYLSKEEVENNSPSRQDGIDLRKETYYRRSYCTFLQDLGMQLKVPQITIATAILFCHRFYLRQSHAKNDRFLIATVCMFLAGKVEETPKPLKEVIQVGFKLQHKKDPKTACRIVEQKEFFENQKDLVLVAERLLLATLAFDLNVTHPYKPLVAAIKSFHVAEQALAQVAWNFVNDGLRTSLCLQYRPHEIAAGAIFLATKFLKVKLPSDWHEKEFRMKEKELIEISNQLLELYEQNQPGPPQRASSASNGGPSSLHQQQHSRQQQQHSSSTTLRSHPSPSPSRERNKFSSASTTTTTNSASLS